MTIAELYVKMLKYPGIEMHDINHLTKVRAYAGAIAALEGLDAQQRFMTEAAAILHDIACPALRKLYGKAEGKRQEELGPALAREFLASTDLAAEQLERLCYLIGHHHTLDEIDGIDYQILIEADYLVNADEAGFSKPNIENMYAAYFKTATGRDLLKTLFIDKIN